MSLGRDAQRVLDAWYDFALCRRPDNSIYGIADGAQCRKGTLTTQDEAITREEASGILRGHVGEEQFSKASPFIEKLTDEELGSLTNKMAMIVGNGRVQAGTMSGEEIVAIKANAEKLIAADEDPSVLTGSLKKVSDAELDAFVTLMGGAKSWGGAGAASQYLQEDGSLGSASEWRGRQVLKRYLEQDGRDGYTGMPLSIRDAALEHIQPKAKGLENAERTENWIWIRGDINDMKEGLSMKSFLQKKVLSVTDINGQQRKFEDARQKWMDRKSFDQARLDSSADAGRTLKHFGGKTRSIINQMVAPNGKKLSINVKGPDRFDGTPTNMRLPNSKKRANLNVWIMAHWPNASAVQRNRIQEILADAGAAMRSDQTKKNRPQVKERLALELDAIGISPPGPEFWEAAL